MAWFDPGKHCARTRRQMELVILLRDLRKHVEEVEVSPADDARRLASYNAGRCPEGQVCTGPMCTLERSQTTGRIEVHCARERVVIAPSGSSD